MRRSIRSGSLKLKQTYEHFLENGQAGALTRMLRSPHDIDIKLLQAKKQQAEMRRYVSENIHLWIYFLPDIFCHITWCLSLLHTEISGKKTYERTTHFLTHLFSPSHEKANFVGSVKQS